MKTKVKGGIFSSFDTFPYQTKNILFGQMTPDSCSAAVCRMLLADEGIDLPEVWLRNALETDEQGTLLSKIAPTLKSLGLSRNYQLLKLSTIEELRENVKQHSAIVVVKVKNDGDLHTILIDEISNDFIFVRDPLPIGAGQSYKVKIVDFEKTWIKESLGGGYSIVVK